MYIYTEKKKYIYTHIIALQQTNMAMDINPIPIANTSTF